MNKNNTSKYIQVYMTFINIGNKSNTINDIYLTLCDIYRYDYLSYLVTLLLPMIV